ncbi:MAG: PucR family transcriptional regulator ligand-binding domain-containing protein [Candidatus Eremiobacteraeota bacterium]|nr:PucR family transcriptional regulator ligand-binding domain-containing protein [Candidatus Eremiobacteraeota bacterium]
MKLADVLALPSFAAAAVVAAEGATDREVAWSHVVDMPDPLPWVKRGFLILTTGYSWPKDEAQQRRQVAELAAREIAGLMMAVPTFVEHFSEAAREQAEISRLPLIEIPFEVPFAQLTEELHRAVMHEPYATIERSDHIHRALTRVAARDATLDDLAQELSHLIERSVTFEDPSGNLLAAASYREEMDEVRRRTLEDGRSPLDVVGAMERSALNRRIRAAEKPLRIAAMPEKGMSARVVCPIRIGNELAGVVWIIEGTSPLNELDHRAAEHAALIAAIHIAHKREITSTEARLGYASFLSLLDSEPGAVSAADERVRLLGFNPEGRYRVGIVAVNEALPLDRKGLERRDRIAATLRELLRRAGQPQLVTATLNRVPFLIAPELDVERIASQLDEAGLSVVIGREHAGVEGARTSYREALSLLGYRDRPRVATYDDLLVPRVITGDASARETFLNDFFAPLRSKKNGRELAAALLTLARHGFRFRAAADALAIHPNTLRYRLERVSEALGLDLADADVQFRVQLAARLLDVEQRDW